MTDLYRSYVDTVALTIPAAIGPDLDDPEWCASIVGQLTDMARHELKVRYPHTTLIAVEWTFARTADELEAWTPAHDCPDCWAAKWLGADKLAAGDVIVCLGTLHCTEPT